MNDGKFSGTGVDATMTPCRKNASSQVSDGTQLRSESIWSQGFRERSHSRKRLSSASILVFRVARRGDCNMGSPAMEFPDFSLLPASRNAMASTA